MKTRFFRQLNGKTKIEISAALVFVHILHGTSETTREVKVYYNSGGEGGSYRGGYCKVIVRHTCCMVKLLNYNYAYFAKATKREHN